jgi:ankyrin repeat protein
MLRSLRYTVLFLSALSAAAFAQEPADSYYNAIRRNDQPALRALVKSGGVNSRDKRGGTPLMYAAAYGSIESVRALLAGGADANAANDFGATALMWGITDPEKVRVLVTAGADVRARSKMGRTPLYLAASNDGSSPTVKLLLDRGANATERDNIQSTPLLAATAANDLASIRLLIEHRANVNETDAVGMTPLINAASNNNVKAVELLLARGASINAVTKPEIGPGVKNGPISLGNFTALIVAAPAGSAELVRILLDAGATVDALDVRKMTPLMLAIATDHADPRVVRLLLERGADQKLKDRYGETAADWARKFNSPAILRELGLNSVKLSVARGIVPVSLLGTPNTRKAAARGVELLQNTGGTFFKEGGCAACHAQNMTAMATTDSRAAGVPVHEGARAADLKGGQFFLASLEQPLLQRMDAPVPEILTFIGLQLAAENAAADRSTDALIHNIAALQRQTGNWHVGWAARPPMSDGDISRTAVAIRILQVYAPAGRKAEMQKRIQRAADWLAAAEPRTTEDLNMQILGLKWAGAPSRALQSGLAKLNRLQREDGGWGQTPNLPSDAYATGETLYTLHEVGAPSNLAGVRYLLQTQAADGSWYVASRAPKIQPYFESGFPYHGDQWISSAGTAWATMALSHSSRLPQIARR